MAMYMLEAGGLVVDKDPEPDPIRQAQFRNPYGFREARLTNLAGVFVNSIKLLDPTLFPNLPADYKLIWMGRPLSEILASWNDVIVAVAGARFWEDPIARAKTVNAQWAAILPTMNNPLVLDYDTVVADPLAAANQIGAFVNTADFTFNAAAAAAVVDTTLYINRSGS